MKEVLRHGAGTLTPAEIDGLGLGATLPNREDLVPDVENASNTIWEVLAAYDVNNEDKMWTDTTANKLWSGGDRGEGLGLTHQDLADKKLRDLILVGNAESVPSMHYMVTKYQSDLNMNLNHSMYDDLSDRLRGLDKTGGRLDGSLIVALQPNSDQAGILQKAQSLGARVVTIGGQDSIAGLEKTGGRLSVPGADQEVGTHLVSELFLLRVLAARGVSGYAGAGAKERTKAITGFHNDADGVTEVIDSFSEEGSANWKNFQRIRSFVMDWEFDFWAMGIGAEAASARDLRQKVFVLTHINGEWAVTAEIKHGPLAASKAGAMIVAIDPESLANSKDAVKTREEVIPRFSAELPENFKGPNASPPGMFIAVARKGVYQQFEDEAAYNAFRQERADNPQNQSNDPDIILETPGNTYLQRLALNRLLASGIAQARFDKLEQGRAQTPQITLISAETQLGRKGEEEPYTKEYDLLQERFVEQGKSLPGSERPYWVAIAPDSRTFAEGEGPDEVLRIPNGHPLEIRVVTHLLSMFVTKGEQTVTNEKQEIDIMGRFSPIYVQAFNLKRAISQERLAEPVGEHSRGWGTLSDLVRDFMSGDPDARAVIHKLALERVFTDAFQYPYAVEIRNADQFRDWVNGALRDKNIDVVRLLAVADSLIALEHNSIDMISKLAKKITNAQAFEVGTNARKSQPVVQVTIPAEGDGRFVFLTDSDRPSKDALRESYGDEYYPAMRKMFEDLRDNGTIVDAVRAVNSMFSFSPRPVRVVFHSGQKKLVEISENGEELVLTVNPLVAFNPEQFSSALSHELVGHWFLQFLKEGDLPPASEADPSFAAEFLAFRDRFLAKGNTHAIGEMFAQIVSGKLFRDGFTTGARAEFLRSLENAPNIEFLDDTLDYLVKTFGFPQDNEQVLTGTLEYVREHYTDDNDPVAFEETLNHMEAKQRGVGRRHGPSRTILKPSVAQCDQRPRWAVDGKLRKS